ncbi:MAG: polyprenol monophosphomannose synthase [Anaerolineales bacterium]|nr:polyprenol monophosphomannose synthase [Anaerolineales bacterium]
MQLTVVTPTFNEADNLPRLATALFALDIPGLKLLVVDDNSPDGTGQVAEALSSQYPHRVSVMHRAGKLGLGSAYVSGFTRALSEGAEAVAQMDADFSHPPEKLAVLLEALQTCDVAMGSRYVPGGAVDHHWPFWRKGLSAFGNIYARTILGLPVRDATGGFRMWRRESLLKMPLQEVRSNGYAFQVEMAYLAYLLGFSFREVPFYFADRQWGHSKMSFQIQKEAALRVWQLLFEYRHLKKSAPAASR